MNKEIKLLIPEPLFESLSKKANSQGVSLEALCVSFLEEKEDLVDPSLYQSLGNGGVKREIQRVLLSDLKKEEKNKRIKSLELQTLRFIR